MDYDPNKVRLGKDPVIGAYVVLGEHPAGKELDVLVIGDNPVIRSHSVIYGGNRIGDNFQCGHGIMLREDNVIGDNVSIGTHSVVERNNSRRFLVQHTSIGGLDFHRGSRGSAEQRQIGRDQPSNNEDGGDHVRANAYWQSWPAPIPLRRVAD